MHKCKICHTPGPSRRSQSLPTAGIRQESLGKRHQRCLNTAKMCSQHAAIIALPPCMPGFPYNVPASTLYVLRGYKKEHISRSEPRSTHADSSSSGPPPETAPRQPQTNQENSGRNNLSEFLTNSKLKLQLSGQSQGRPL